MSESRDVDSPAGRGAGPAQRAGGAGSADASPALREVLIVEEESRPAGGAGATAAPSRRVAVAAVVANPLAGAGEEDLYPLLALGAELGRYLAERLLGLVNGAPLASVGRAALVGEAGEVEHAAALLGAGFAGAVRRVLGAWRVSHPSTKRIGHPGEVVAVELEALADAPADAAPQPPLEVRVPGHPTDDEVVVVLAAAESASGSASAAGTAQGGSEAGGGA